MPRLHPLRALRYSEDAGDPCALLAPPYDVISPEEARRLRERHPFNSVRLVLPTGENGGDDGPYAAAARRLEAWLRDGVLRPDREPCLYVYRQTFEVEGSRRTRTAVFGAVDVTPFGEGGVLPHEETHREPKEDRLALTEACRAQLSPVFLLARDRSGALTGELEPGAAGTPALRCTTPDGIEHALWPVRQGVRTGAIGEAVEAGPLLIADGHHRYETALEFRRRHPELVAASRVLACVVSSRDPGLLTLPTHRTLRRPPAGAGGWDHALSASFRVEPLEVDGPDEAARHARRAADALVVLGGRGPARALRPRDDAVRASGFQPEETGTPAVAFDRLVLRECFEADPDLAVERGLLSYHRDPGEAVAAAGRDGLAFLLPPLEVEEVWRLARARGRLPPKSTYFWPKLPSGLLFRPLAPDLA